MDRRCFLALLGRFSPAGDYGGHDAVVAATPASTFRARLQRTFWLVVRIAQKQAGDTRARGCRISHYLLRREIKRSSTSIALILSGKGREATVMQPRYLFFLSVLLFDASLFGQSELIFPEIKFPPSFSSRHPLQQLPEALNCSYESKQHMVRSLRMTGME